jgi:2-amino-4-hydroxy-6-hydroxymethyldihydropteridine diphosphokinase
MEARFGRKRLFKNGPRTLDLDLLLFEKANLTTPTLTLPHPGVGERPSISLPLLLPLLSQLHRKRFWLQLREKRS